MNFLEKLNFSKDEILELEDVVPENLLEIIVNQKKLVEDNINYLRNLGVNNYQIIFINYYDIFLMDSSNFQDIFNKYDNEDLIAKLNKNYKIVEYL